MSQRVKDGTLKPLTDPLTGQRYLDREAADADWDANTDPSKLLAAGGDGGNLGGDESEFDYGEARAKREHFKAELEAIAYRQKIGELVEVAEVRKQAFEDGRAIRQAVLTVPDRLAPALAAETDINRIHALITAELIQALQELDRIAPPPPAAEEGAPC